MRSKVALTVKDRGWNKILDKAKRSKGLRLDVGFVGPKASAKHADSKLTVAVIAAIHEFGAGRVPERSFLRSTMESNQARYIAMIATAASLSVLGTQTVESALAHIGDLIVSDIVQAVKSGIEPPLSEETERKKAAKNQPLIPLIATKQMIEAVTFAVRREFRDSYGRFTSAR